MTANERADRPAFAVVRAVVRVEVGYALLLLSAFVLPEFIAFRAWIPALALATALAVGHGLLAGRRPILPLAIAAYLGVYLLALVASDRDTFSAIEAGKFFATPVFALAVAWAAQSVEVRRRLLLMMVAAMAIQLPVVLFQSARLIATTARNEAVRGVDGVTGLLSEGTAGTLTLSALLVALIVLAAGLLGCLRMRPALILGSALILIGAFSSTRASYGFALLSLLAVAITYYVANRDRVDRGFARRMFAYPLAVVAVLFALTGALYPGANLIFGSEGAGSYFGEQFERDPDSELPEEVRTVLPGRVKQLTIAVDLSVAEGPGRALLGKGIGSTRFKDQGIVDPTGGTFQRISREEQKTNGIWAARTITEAGYLGLLAFFGLLAYLVLLTRRGMARLSSPAWDSALLLALPGIAVLTLCAAFFNTILAVQPYATLLWAVVGIAIAIDAERWRSDEPAGPADAEAAGNPAAPPGGAAA